MNNQQLLPFERNRYYAGKMLASADFLAEQLYMNNKRRFLNAVMYGSGVVCGLGVRSLDDLSILMDSGMAVDESGREIVVETAVVRKLSSISGFETLTKDQAQLRIKYSEEKVHPVYAVGYGEDGDGYECNRIREGYELFLKEEGESSPKQVSFLRSAVLLLQEDYCVTVNIPSAVSQNRFVKLVVCATKLSDRPVNLSLESIFQLPSFKTEEGNHELSVIMREVSLEKGQSHKQEYWIQAMKISQESSSIILKEGSAQAFIGEFDVSVRSDVSLKISIRQEDPKNLVLEQTKRKNLDIPYEESEDGILLARVSMFRTEGACVIAGIEEAKEYIALPASEQERAEYLSYFKDPADREEKVLKDVTQKEDMSEKPHSALPMFTSGLLEIPLDVNMKKGDVCLSEEILHGLGKGDVFVQVGIVSMEDDNRMNQSVTNTIYGDSDLFGSKNHSFMQTAVKVYNDKGSFQVAVRLNGEQRSIVQQIRWVAMRFTSSYENRLAEDFSGMSISPRMPSVQLRPGGSHHIDIVFRNMAPCRLLYELIESGSGEITQEGVYSAPAAAGVYEIHVYCADIPEISTYVYAVVEK